MSIETIQTGLDLYDYVMQFGNQPGGPSDDYGQQVRATIQKEYWDLLQLERWWWATPQQPAIVVIRAKTDALVTTITGPTVTLSQSLATSQANNKFALQANSIVYRVSAHTAGTNVLTLDADYVETPTAGSAWIYQDEFPMPADCLKPWGPFRVRGRHNLLVDLYPASEYEQRWGGNLVSLQGTIGGGFIFGGRQNAADGNMQQLVRFAGFSDLSLVLECPYTQFHQLDFSGSVATDCPRLPRTDRWVIAEQALWTLWRNKNETIADSAAIKAKVKLDQMTSFHLGMPSRERLHMRPEHSLRAG